MGAILLSGPDAVDVVVQLGVSAMMIADRGRHPVQQVNHPPFVPLEEPTPIENEGLHLIEAERTTGSRFRIVVGRTVVLSARSHTEQCRYGCLTMTGSTAPSAP